MQTRIIYNFVTIEVKELKAAGIIAEFDPFHNGHKYLLEQARERGATHIAVIMSGSAVQRGTPAFYDKYFRAETAVKNGADLVIEMPAPYSCSNAEVFARTGITALASLGEGLIETLYFGSETDDTALLIKAAEASAALKDSETVRGLLKEGLSYPAAVCQACRLEYGNDLSSALENPNSTLAVEYCKAISDIAPKITPCAILRKESGHDSTDISEGFASGTKLREMISRGQDVTGLVPYTGYDFCNVKKLDSVYLYKLATAERDELLELPDGDASISDRFFNAAKESFADSEVFLAACKSKNFTAAKLRRLALQLVLGIKKEDILPLPYLRILAFNKRGTELLKAADPSLPIGTSLAELERSSDCAARIVSLEKRASVLRSLGTSSGRTENEYTRQIRITDF